MAAPAKTYTLEELNKHNTTDDLWIAIQGRVYNITPFLEEHPGGDGVLVDNAGVDCTGEFEAVGHSDEARATLEQFYIGDLVTADGAPVKSERAPVKPQVSLANAKAPKPKVAAPAPAVWKQAAVPLLIIAIGFVLRYYFSS